MKYYIYISDAKVDMLFSQIPHDIKKKVALEFGFDLKLFSAKRKVETELEDDRIARLEAVLAFIREYGKIGTVDKPNEYIEGTMAMRFISYSGSLEREEGIYLSGHTKKTAIGLGGSAKHLVGGMPVSSDRLSGNSLTYAILSHVRELVDESEIKNPQMWGEVIASLESMTEDDSAENFEFVAKRLLFTNNIENTDSHYRQALLATPLYLAKAD
jgi:hypothetical protein